MKQTKPVGNKILFVINPISGDIQKSSAEEEIFRYCKENDKIFYIYRTSGENDGEKIGKVISGFFPSIVVAVGGDGTVNLCASLLKSLGIPLGILPLGSGNGLSKDLNIPQNNIPAALSLLSDPNVKTIDTLEANGHFFVHLCDIGFNARIVECYTAGTRRGLTTYAYYMLREFFNYKSSRYEIIEKGKKPLKIKAFMITVANSNKYGSNIVINPEGKPDDGKFEVVIIKSFPRKEIPKLMLQILFKRIHFSPYSRIISTQHITIRHKRAKTLQVDGELLGKHKEVEVSIFPGSLKVCVPDD